MGSGWNPECPQGTHLTALSFGALPAKIKMTRIFLSQSICARSEQGNK